MSELIQLTGSQVRDPVAVTATLNVILDIIAEAEQVPTFAGFQVNELKDKHGKLLYIQLVACDDLNGIIAPRVDIAPAVKADVVEVKPKQIVQVA